MVLSIDMEKIQFGKKKMFYPIKNFLGSPIFVKSLIDLTKIPTCSTILPNFVKFGKNRSLDHKPDHYLVNF